MSQLFASDGQSIGASYLSPIVSNEYSGLISFRIAWFDLLAVQGTLKSLLQHRRFENVNSSALSLLYGPTLTSYITTGKPVALTIRSFVGKVMSLLFNMLSRSVIAFLPRRKHFLISWLQSPSAVILELKKIKSVTVSIVSSLICHLFDGTGCHDLSFLNVEF